MSADANDIAIIYLSNPEDSSCKTQLNQLGYKHIIGKRENESTQELFRRALSSRYNYYISISPEDDFSLKDLQVVAKAFMQEPETLFIGIRQNKAGDNAVSAFFSFLSGLDADSVDSSLMAMNRETLALMAEMESYEDNFLFNIPLVARANNIEIKTIETDVVCNERARPKMLIRSFKLYLLFAKFGVTSLAAYAADFISFFILSMLLNHLPNRFKILYATVLSRVLSSVVAYFLNKEAVFKTHGSDAGFILRFTILSVVQMFASWLLVLGISTLMGTGNMGNLAAKIVVDFIIFMVSFTIQRDWVFKKTDGMLK